MNKLLNEALAISGLETKIDTINYALKELVYRHKQLEIIDLFGSLDPDPNYDYKEARKR